MIGIIGAMASEVDDLKAAMQEKENKKIGVTEYCEGILFGARVVVAKSGIGKVNAALCTQNIALPDAAPAHHGPGRQDTQAHRHDPL